MSQSSLRGASLEKLEINCFNLSRNLPLYKALLFGNMCRSMLSKLWLIDVRLQSTYEREWETANFHKQDLLWHISPPMMLNHKSCILSSSYFIFPPLSLFLLWLLPRLLPYLQCTAQKDVSRGEGYYYMEIFVLRFFAVAVCKTIQKHGIVNRNFH